MSGDGIASNAESRIRFLTPHGIPTIGTPIGGPPVTRIRLGGTRVIRGGGDCGVNFSFPLLHHVCGVWKLFPGYPRSKRSVKVVLPLSLFLKVDEAEF